PVPAAPAAALPPELARLFDLLSGVENSSRCLIVGENDQVVGEAPVKDMIETISALGAPAKALVFDGIVSQRVLDVAQEKGIGVVVGSRLGPIGKAPDQVRVFTKADLGPAAGGR
ncbi:TOPRIM domain protein, partial [mine drainage metagenome]